VANKDGQLLRFSSVLDSLCGGGTVEKNMILGFLRPLLLHLRGKLRCTQLLRFFLVSDSLCGAGTMEKKRDGSGEETKGCTLRVLRMRGHILAGKKMEPLPTV
jgi:hypothetical protein